VNWYAHSSKFLKPFYPSLIWNIQTEAKTVYLTFDDGPNPTATNYVLSILESYGFTATFFCIGDNVVKHPETYALVIDKGHAVGNHTFNHLNGFAHTEDAYLSNTKIASECIDSELFRPPYGRIKKSQITALSSDFNIIMWSCLSGDFDANLDTSRALKKLQKLTKPGAIVVFHDSLKALENLKILLPAYCEYLVKNGFQSCKL